jgi:hypothetical protein
MGAATRLKAPFLHLGWGKGVWGIGASHSQGEG